MLSQMLSGQERKLAALHRAPATQCNYHRTALALPPAAAGPGFLPEAAAAFDASSFLCCIRTTTRVRDNPLHQTAAKPTSDRTHRLSARHLPVPPHMSQGTAPVPAHSRHVFASMPSAAALLVLGPALVDAAAARAPVNTSSWRREETSGGGAARCCCCCTSGSPCAAARGTTALGRVLPRAGWPPKACRGRGRLESPQACHWAGLQSLYNSNLRSYLAGSAGTAAGTAVLHHVGGLLGGPCRRCCGVSR